MRLHSELAHFESKAKFSKIAPILPVMRSSKTIYIYFEVFAIGLTPTDLHVRSWTKIVLCIRCRHTFKNTTKEELLAG